MPIGDGTTVAGFTFEIQGNFVPVAGGDMAIQAVDGDVELPVGKPLCHRTLFALWVRFGPRMDGLKRGIPLESIGGGLPVSHPMSFIDLLTGCIRSVVGLTRFAARIDVGICGIDDPLGEGTGQAVGHGSVLLVKEFGCQACAIGQGGISGVDRGVRHEVNLSIGSGGSTCTVCGCCGVVEPDLLAALDGYSHNFRQKSFVTAIWWSYFVLCVGQRRTLYRRWSTRSP